MKSLEISTVAQGYLKAVWTAAEWSVAPVTVSELAQRMRVSPSTASETVARLASQGLVLHERYAGVELTESGAKIALRMVRRHRLIETFLVQALGYSWDEVHDEAEVLERAVSDSMVARIDALLGRPDQDPHGDPIPTEDGVVAKPDHATLMQVPAGKRYTIARISDAEPGVLRFLADQGIGIGEAVEVIEQLEAADLVAVRVVATGKDVHLSTRVASFVRVPRPMSG